MIPPNTPVCTVGIPHADAMVPSIASPITSPLSDTVPDRTRSAKIAVFMTRYAITDEIAATSFSAFAMPIATPTANKSAR